MTQQIISMIFLEDRIWFSPLNVIHHFRELENKLSDKEKSSKGFRKAEEMYSVALMLVGIIKSQNREYWLQMVDDKSSSPDVKTGTYQQKEGAKMPDFTIQDVEVVDFDKNFQEKSLTDFLKRTKLSDTKKSYDSLTTILCRVKSSIHLPSFNQMNQELKPTTFSGPVMILGRTSVDEEKPVYKIAQIENRGANEKFLPRHLLLADKMQKQISRGFAKIQTQKKLVFAKPSPN